MKKIIITIDGYSSCGKSTLAKQLAKELNYVFIDSGAMYRAITLYFLRNHINWQNNKSVTAELKNINLEFAYNNHAGKSDMILNDENVEALIREMLVSEHVSEVSTIKAVREFAVAQQKKMGNKNLLRFSALVLILSVFQIHFVNAQMVGVNAYIQGTSVEIGIAGAGGFEGAPTTASPVPGGMHFRSGNPYFGFVSNPQVNAWTTFDGNVSGA